MTVRTIDEIFRDFVTDGVPASGPFNPHKPDIRDTLKALTEGGDNFPDNRVIRLNNADEGTANNIVVTASVAIPAAAYQVLYILNVTQENTGPVTVSGAINRDLVTNLSQPVPAGYLLPGMALLAIDTGTELRLLSYGDAEAVQEAAEEAAVRAEAAASSLNLPTIQPGDVGKSLVVNADEDGYVLGSSSAGEYDSRAKVEEISVPETAIFLRTAGYYAAGDGGGALYKRSASEPSHAGKVQSLDGAWWELSDIELNVLQFGAVADSTGVGVGTDNSAIFNSAMLAAISLRRNLHIPAGGYRLSSPLVYDKTALDGDSGYVPNIRGDGVSMTRLYCSSGGISVTGVTTAGYYGSFFNISDIYLRGNNTSGIGIDVVACGFVGINNVRSTQFGTGCRFKGVISSKLEKPFFDSNVDYGFQALPDDGNVMPPNAITVDQPWIGSNGRCGIQLNQPATFNIRGGSVEGNGANTAISEAERGGIIILNAGVSGHNAITSEGVYYEHNEGIADVLLFGSSHIFSASFEGNTFTRLDSTPVKHNIYATGATHNVTINLNGNGFGELGGGFVPTSEQRYVQIDGGANIYTLVDIGNQYMTAAARPNYQTCRIISNNTMPYAMGYCTAAGTIEGAAFNVQSITKTGTGGYKINFGEAISGRKFAICSFGNQLNYNVFTSDDSSITINIHTIGTTPTLTDAEFGFVVYTTAWW